MLDDFLSVVDPSTDANKLRSLSLFANLSLPDSSNGQQLLATARMLLHNLASIDIETLISLRVIQAFDQAERYEGIVNSFKNGDSTVVGCSLNHLATLVTNEDSRLSILNPSDQAPPSAKKAKANTPAPSPSPNPPKQPSMEVTYPPVGGVKWSAIQDLLDAGRQCHCCFSGDSFHLKEGCPVLASKGKVVIDDEEAAKAIMTKYAAHRPRPPGGPGGRGPGAGRGRGRGGRGPPPPPPKNDANPSARRATSSERSAPSPAPAPVPPTPACATPNQFAGLDTCQYVDNEEIPSDPDDDAAFDHEFSNIDNSKTQFTDYLTHSTPKARRVQANHVSSVLSDIATKALSSNQDPVCSPSSSSVQCCADSGATDTMLPDKKAFISYHPTPNSFVSLGDGTQLQQRGVGTAKIMLNGKVILLRNVLHVPALSEPLYSLRRHRMMPECGYYSSYDTGSHILFPTFVLEVDTTVDNVLSYKSIGRSSDKIDYAEPRVYPTPQPRPVARPAHLIPPDNEMARVTFNVPTPKSGPPPPSSQPPTPSPPTPESSPPDTSTVVPISDDELITASSAPLSTKTLASLHPDPSNLPPVPPASTPGPAEARTTFDPLKLHRIFGCRRFLNQQHVIAASANAKLTKQGELPVTLGDFSTMNKPNKGKPLTKHRHYLDKVHMDIVFGDCLGLGGYRYALLLVDVATRYTWVYGMQALTSNEIISCFEQFVSAAGATPKCFHSDFDKKLIGGKALRWIQEHKSRIIASPSQRQSSNGLVERTWQTLVRMARAYITEKQVGREYWYFAIKHSSLMINQVPGRLGRKLTSPFELVHGVKPDSSTWFELFSVGYFPHGSDDGESKSKSQANTLDGIAVGRDEQTNTVLFYNPISKQYYRPAIFKLDEGRLPITCFPKSIRFDGGLTCGLVRNKSDPAPEPFPPGTRVTLTVNGQPSKGTVSNVPLPYLSSVVSASVDDAASEDQNTKYVIQLDDGTTKE
eukprot:scaffold56081_cov49-Cyclotella_meneghiniana.AAC.1